MIMDLTTNQIKYLLTIYELDPKARGVRSISIANKLHITRASVHAMLDKLEDLELITKEHYGIVFLTDVGLEMSKNYLQEVKK